MDPGVKWLVVVFDVPKKMLVNRGPLAEKALHNRLVDRFKLEYYKYNDLMDCEKLSRTQGE